ncbi:MAG: hypothetical protein ABR884_00190 [Minisyncoccia bacterium]|jgi:hypothetical protein
MIDVKKLITGFLILAVAAVCSGLIFSLANFSSPATTNAASGIAIGAGTAAADNANAFLPTEEQVQETAAALAPELASSTMLVSSTDPTNLTDDLAAEFVNGVVAANPNGATGTDTDGNPTFTSPDVNAIAANIADSTTTQALQIPNWDTEVAAIPVTVVATTSATALTNYGDAVNGILNSHLNAQVQSIASDQTDGATASELTYVQSQVQSALQDTASLKTPAPAEAYQKSLLANLVYEKNMIQLYTLAQTDPVKASLIFSQEDTKFSAVQQNFANQAQELTSNYLSLEQVPQKPQNGILLSFINNTFGVPEAHALLPVFDPATWALIISNEWTTIQTQLEGILKNMLLQILKNVLIAIIQQKVLAWVQGSGAPRFITNWGTTLINVAQTNALNALNKDMTCGAYSAFVPQINITLKAFYSPSANNCANQFQAALGANTFQQFYNNFSNGGFVAFGASTLPSGNPYGAQFFEAQKTDISYHNQQAATALQTQTSQGFKGDAVCTDGSNPNGNSTVCENPNGTYDPPNITGGACPAGDKSTTVSNGGLCEDGTQPIVQTPAAVTGFTVQTTAGGNATVAQVTAATDIVGILNSVMSSIVMGLANAAVNAAGKLVNQTLSSPSLDSNITSGANLSGITTSTIASTSAAISGTLASIPLACNPLTQTIPSASASTPTSTGLTATSTSPVSLSAAGGTLDANDNPPTYNWSDSNGVTGTGSFFSDTFTIPGTYTVTLGDSTGDAPTTCTVIQQ